MGCCLPRSSRRVGGMGSGACSSTFPSRTAAEDGCRNRLCALPYSAAASGPARWTSTHPSTHGVAACHHQRARVDHPLVCTNTCMVAARRTPATTAVSPLPSITRRLCFHASIAPTARRRPRGDLEPHVASSPPSWPARKPPSTLGSARVARAARCYSRGHGRRAPPHPMPPRAPRWWRPRQHDHRHRHRHRDCVMSSAVSLARHLCGV